MSFGHGESVCAPMMLKPLPGSYFSPTANATMEDMFLVKKYRPPGFNAHSSRSERRVKPASVNILALSAVAWNEVHELLR